MMRKKTIVKILLGILGALLFIAAPFLLKSFLLYWVFTGGDIPHKTDAEMIANFKAHKREFEQLLQMVVTDKGLTRVDDNWTSPEDPQTIGLSKLRLDEYRKLFQKVGTPRGFSANAVRDSIEFISSAQGMVTHGSSKSYVYTTIVPSLIVENIDSYREQNNSFYPVYKRIEGNWYIRFDLY
jgi:hypothetical protein